MTRTIDKSESQIVPVTPSLPVPAGLEPSIGAILQHAVSTGVPIEMMEKIVALYERTQDRAAAREFADAMAAFKAECPAIPRRTENSQFKVTRDGLQVPRRYASLEDIEATIREPLGKHGLSFRWGDAVVRDGMLTIACIVSHRGGHSERASCSIPVESKAGCSDQQKYGTAGTYAQRYSLIAALGLTSCDEDTDGNAAPAATITADQADTLDTLLREVKANVPAFLKWVGVEKLADIPAARYKAIIAEVEKKRKGTK